MKSFVEADKTQDNQKSGGSYPLGNALRDARLKLGWSLDRASDETEVSRRQLEHIEEGIRLPSVDTLQTLASAYGIDPAQLEQRPAARRVAPQYDETSERLKIGNASIAIPKGSSNDYILEMFGQVLRSLRDLEPHQPAYVRGPELPVLAWLLDLEDEQLAFDSMQHLGLTWMESGEFLRMVNEAASVSATS